MVTQFSTIAKKSDLCNWVCIPCSSYYYKSTNARKGIKPSTHTKTTNGDFISNEQVVTDITAILSEPFAAFGYEYVTYYLRDVVYGYIINKKKVYRLMNENNLLMGKVIKTHGKRDFVKHRKITATKPLEYLCLDIKYIWVSGEKRNYYLLSIMDVYSRKILEWTFQKSIRQQDVINLFRSINLQHGLKGVNIRNDNGSQFIANMVRAFLKKEEAIQEFTHIATPQENAYIESFHSILDYILIQRMELESYYEAKRELKAFMYFYNNTRKHRSLKFLTPVQKWEQSFYNDSTDRPQIAAQGLLSRPIDANKNQISNSIVTYSLYNNMDLAQICQSGESLLQKNNKTGENVSNIFS